MSIITDNKVLVNICSCLKSKNKVTLGLLAALTAENEGHQVTLFLEGNGINILNCKKAGEIVGKGTGDLYELLENLLIDSRSNMEGINSLFLCPLKLKIS